MIRFAGLSNLLMQLPLIILWTVGIVVALVRWSRHPKVSLLVVIGLLILLFQTLVSGVLIPWLQISFGMSASRMGMLMSVVSVITALIKTGAWIMILVAVFSGRQSRDTAAEVAASS